MHLKPIRMRLTKLGIYHRHEAAAMGLEAMDSWARIAVTPG